MEDASGCTFVVGENFASFVELEQKIEKYQKIYSTQLYRRDSRKIDSACKRAPKKYINVKKELEYTDIRYCCIHGGKKYKTESKGIRPEQQ